MRHPLCPAAWESGDPNFGNQTRRKKFEELLNDVREIHPFKIRLPLPQNLSESLKLMAVSPFSDFFTKNTEFADLGNISNVVSVQSMECKRKARLRSGRASVVGL